MTDTDIKEALEDYRSCTGQGHGLRALLGKRVLEDLGEFLCERIVRAYMRELAAKDAAEKN